MFYKQLYCIIIINMTHPAYREASGGIASLPPSVDALSVFSNTEGSLEWLEAQHSKLDYLDALTDLNSEAACRTAYQLCEMEADIICERFGVETLVWTAANANRMAFSNDAAKKYRNALEGIAGYDERLLERAYWWIGKHKTLLGGRAVLGQYALEKALHSDISTSLDLPALLQVSAITGQPLSDKRIADYSLIPLKTSKNNSFGYENDWGQREEGDRIYNIWLDAPAGFALAYKGLPQAIASMAVNPRCHDEVMIYQLQGVRPIRKRENSSDSKGSARGLAPLDWKKFLLRTTASLAREIGVLRVGVQASENNKYVKAKANGQSLLPHKTAVRIYDEPAIELGFTRGDDDNWHASL